MALKIKAFDEGSGGRADGVGPRLAAAATEARDQAAASLFGEAAANGLGGENITAIRKMFA